MSETATRAACFTLLQAVSNAGETDNHMIHITIYLAVSLFHVFPETGRRILIPQPRRMSSRPSLALDRFETSWSTSAHSICGAGGSSTTMLDAYTTDNPVSSLGLCPAIALRRFGGQEASKKARSVAWLSGPSPTGHSKAAIECVEPPKSRPASPHLNPQLYFSRPQSAPTIVRANPMSVLMGAKVWRSTSQKPGKNESSSSTGNR
jgi:hypothetical protein